MITKKLRKLLVLVGTVLTNTEMKRAVIGAFRRMGSSAAAAEPFIRKSTSDPDELTSMFANWALKEIKGRADQTNR